MFREDNRGRRAAAEAKALEKKMLRNGGEIRGRDAARLNRVRGSVVKFGIADEDQENDNQPRR